MTVPLGIDQDRDHRIMFSRELFVTCKRCRPDGWPSSTSAVWAPGARSTLAPHVAVEHTCLQADRRCDAVEPHGRANEVAEVSTKKMLCIAVILN